MPTTRIDFLTQVKNVPPFGTEMNPAHTFHWIAVAGNNAGVVKSAAGTVYGWTVYNNSDKIDSSHVGYPIYVKLYDKNASPDPASDTPLRTIGVQAGTHVSGPDYDGGLSFGLGIGMVIVRGIADDNNTAVAAGDCVVDISYI